MEPTTDEDRRNELRSLLARIEQHPERDMTAERQRVQVLRQLVGGTQETA
ncbi:conserved hypothetical protein [Altererythrobacter sp. B11]|nr:hypothetical protein [Altererythrobacter sp. B11]BBC71123.1 conserved hypothetical protein [Altererythrobacter sp. B11]